VNDVQGRAVRSAWGQTRQRKGRRGVPEIGAAAGGRRAWRNTCSPFRKASRRSRFSIPSIDEAGRDAHLNAKVATSLMAKAGELLTKPPTIHKITNLADKLP
jgi:hypothetical protein